MKVAYFSPFAPDASGISDYSDDLVKELINYVDIDLFTNVPVSSEKIKKQFSVFLVRDIEDDALRQQYDLMIFQAGNNARYHKDILEMFMKYGGILELHDFAMHHYLAEVTYAKGEYEEYKKVMEYCHGYKGKRAAVQFLNGEIPSPWDHQSQRFTVNKYLIDKASAVIVHSDMAKQMVMAVRPEIPVLQMPISQAFVQEDFWEHKKECKERLRIAQSKQVLGSFGFATASKRIIPILNGLSIYKESSGADFVYYIVGKVEDRSIYKTIKRLKLSKNVVVTGRVSMDDFMLYMGACDICFNLRYPTQGESSGCLHQGIAMGKPVFVTNVGSFEEYPDSFTCRVRYDGHEPWDIAAGIEHLLQDEAALQECGKQAVAYAKEHFNIKKNVKMYADFLEEIAAGTYAVKDEVDVILNRLFAQYDREDITVEMVMNQLNKVCEDSI